MANGMKSIDFGRSAIKAQDCEPHELAWIVAAEEERGVTPMTTLRNLRAHIAEEGVPDEVAHQTIQEARIFYEAHLSERQREDFVRKLYEER